MASPGLMTGFILAMARAAGEVAPLMLTGAIKNSPVPLDGLNGVDHQIHQRLGELFRIRPQGRQRLREIQRDFDVAGGRFRP